ncbi:MAG: hypothetical protein AAGD25_06775 [Cyanobacteria bacterium P01_F01_bin.150]
MSLDVYLSREVSVPLSDVKITVEGGLTLSVDEFNKRYKDHSIQGVSILNEEEVFWRNITHNLNAMAKAAGLYQCMWCPEDVGIKYARDLIEPLTNGLKNLTCEPSRFTIYNPSNGWGEYGDLVNFAHAYLEACKKYPDSVISVSR